MIQFTTQPLPGLAPAPRAAGFPLGTTSDFALALAELAGVSATGLAPPGAAVELPPSNSPVTQKRQVLADGGTMLPVAADTMILMDCLMTDIPTLVPVEGVSLPEPGAAPVIGQPVTGDSEVDDDVILAGGENLDDDTASVVAPVVAEPDRTTVIAAPIIPDIRAVVAVPLPVMSREIAPRAPAPPSLTVTAQPPVTPTSDRTAVRARPIGAETPPLSTRVQPSAGGVPAPEGVPFETTARVPAAAEPAPTDAPIIPAVAASPPVANPTLTVSDTTLRPAQAPEASKQSAPAPEVAARPAQTPTTPSSQTPAAGLAPVAVPMRAPQIEPLPVATDTPPPIDVPIMARSSAPAAIVPSPSTTTNPQPDATVLPAPTTITGATPAFTRRLDQAFAPVARTGAPARTTSMSAIPAHAERPTKPADSQTAPVAAGLAPAIAVGAPAAAPTQQFFKQPVEHAPVTVTVVPLPATVAPATAPQLQPAAQAFAAAMFAASAPIDTRQDASDDDLLPITLTNAVQTAPQSATIAVAAPTQGQAPALDLAKDDWMATMIDRIETLRDDSGGIRETRMKLLPEALGNVEVSVRRDETGAIQVRIAADTAQARALLAEAAPKLAEMAEARGVKLGGSSVDAGAGDTRRDAPAPAPTPVARRPASARTDTTTDASSDTRLA